ncbi:MAG TPA: TIGR00730 family Rossman fold protein [Actinomycetota bacterium]|nr:TIGR00730 family Rossman fold protein [Actinomycetota bacterium]
MTDNAKTTSPEIEALLEDYIRDLPEPDAELAREIVTTALKLAREQVSRLDRKIVNTALKEMRHAFRIFAPYKGIRKVTIFGSARTTKGDPAYVATRDFSRAMAERGWMVITGAGPGIMEAGHEGAGDKLSFGVNIRLPFEAKPNPVIANDSKLINFKYFFTRKLTFMKEADAFVLVPGGFGTLDETFELLTLVQTGKADLQPIVLLEPPGSDYWAALDTFIREELLERGFVNADDLTLYRRAGTIEDAVAEIENFYRVFHSQRMVGNRLILRLNLMPDDVTLKELSEEFSDILTKPIEPTTASRAEIRDEDVPNLPRISLAFDRQHIGRLRLLVDRLNELGPEPDSPIAEKGRPEEL